MSARFVIFPIAILALAFVVNRPGFPSHEQAQPEIVAVGGSADFKPIIDSEQVRLASRTSSGF